MTITPEPVVADTLGSIGESAVLARIFPRLPAAASALLGPGDDCAVVAAPDGRFVVTTDMMIHGPDFRLAWSTPHDLGWKAAASNLADVAAMGAVPSALVVAIAAPADSPVSLLEGIADGLRDACETLAPGCGVVGGDLSVSATITIAVTAFGDLEGRTPVLRSGASPGDTVAVAGPLGEAALALRLLFSNAVDPSGRPDAALATALRSRTAPQLAPTPPIAAGRVAALAGATAMLDLSDGLAIDCARLARASGVGVDFASATLGPDTALALAGGEDHSLLATFPPGATLPAEFRRIGVCIEGQGLTVDGSPHDSTGWDPYRDWAGSAG
ncbi:thiamine-phosphate kinase [Frigoribacterium sp. CG_9.8]|uniref:thiamine-phosphate kinase n=1 Tax=Frigoribacterium sp. CG_9.8 TaxID=2787733 RepID=UPI0018CACB54|nr:thiamine-phosphate kinase [Frigoribacterium sp. CG_9.8]MBG6106969.1 thiamine-monophosphate kinase [Frigoribacterium sp. CG_9.8]